jgi:lipoate synthase
MEMAKRVKTKAPEERKQEFSPEQLLALAAELRELAGLVQAVAADMKSRNLDELTIDGATKPSQAHDKLRQFVANAQWAMAMVKPQKTR